MTDTETHATYMRLPCLHKSFQQVFLGSGSFYTALAPCSHACTTDLGLHRTSCRQPISSILSLYQPTSSTHFINTIIVSTISSILSLYQPTSSTHFINTIIVSTISSILSLYQPISSILLLYQVRGPTTHLINTITVSTHFINTIIVSSQRSDKPSHQYNHCINPFHQYYHCINPFHQYYHCIKSEVRQPISSIQSLYQPISSILSLYQVRGPTSHLINTIIAKEDETRARSEKSLLGPLCCVAKQVLDKAETCIHSSTDMRCSLQCDHL